MRKKLFAVIMSVMMMVTFMPAMAFATTSSAATTEGKWNYNHTVYTTAATPTDAPAKTDITKVARTMDTNGKFTVMAYKDNGDPIEESVEEYFDLSKFVVRSFGPSSDDLLKGSTIAYDKAYANSLIGSTGSIPVYGWFDAAGIADYVDTIGSVGSYKLWGQLAYPANKPVSTQVNQIDSTYNITMKKFDFDAENKYTDQADTLDVECTIPTGAINVQGVLAPKTITVKGKAEVEANDAEYVIDGKKAVEFGANYVATNLTDIYYDGAEHTIAQKELTGVTSTLEVYNTKTGNWDTTANATYKNAGDYKFRFTPAKGETKGEVRIINFTVYTNNVEFAFSGIKEGYSIDNQGVIYNNNGYNVADAIVVEKGFKATDYVDVVKDSSVVNTDQKKALDKAIKADKEALMAYFNAYYVVKTEPNAQDENIIEAEIVKNDELELTYAEKKTALEAYKTLLANFGVTVSNPSDMAEGKIADGATCDFVIDNENAINWKKAPLTKTYKAKNGKLPKNKTFKIKATSSAKTPVTYRLTKGGSMIKINKTSGKVTVKKGLKKGTYKVYVHAQAKYSTKYSAYANDSYTLKIKVK